MNCQQDIDIDGLKIKTLEKIKSSIDMMTKINHIEILKILKDNNAKINENKSGVYINMSFLHDDVINKIKEFVNFITEQEKSLEVDERQKMELSKYNKPPDDIEILSHII